MPRILGTGGLSDFLRSAAGATLELALARALSETLRQLKRPKLDPACLSMTAARRQTGVARTAVLVVIGSGASEKAGVSEARFALGYLTSNWEALGKFKRAFGEINLEKIRAAIEPALVAEVRSKNTRQELVEAGRLFRKERCDRVILVSSPTHLPRCLRDACSLWLEPHSSSLNDNEGDDEDGWRQRWHPVVLASPSDMSFVDFGPNDVAIVEPPHRPGGGFLETVALSPPRMLDKSTQDAAKIAEDVEETAPLLHKLVASALKVGEEDRRQFHREFHALLRRYVPEE